MLWELVHVVRELVAAVLNLVQEVADPERTAGCRACAGAYPSRVRPLDEDEVMADLHWATGRRFS